MTRRVLRWGARRMTVGHCAGSHGPGPSVAVPAYPPASRDPRHWSRLVSIIKDATPRLVLTEAALAGSEAQFKAGKDKVFGYFVGQVMKATRGKGNPQLINDILRRELEG